MEGEHVRDSGADAGSTGQAGRLGEDGKGHGGFSVPGNLGTYVYRLDSDPNTIIMAVAFKDKASYRANAESPEQNTRYEQMRALLTADPEWSDGEIIYPQA
jgi:hypothetical protein